MGWVPAPAGSDATGECAMRSVIRLCLAFVLVLGAPTAAAAAPPTFNGDPSPIAFLDLSTNNLYVFGDMTCSKKIDVEVFVNVRQPVPDTDPPAVERSDGVTVACSKQTSIWVIELSPADGFGTYTPGPATLAYGFASGTGVFGREVPLVIIGF